MNRLPDPTERTWEDDPQNFPDEPQRLDGEEIKKLHGRTYVIKYGGVPENSKESFLECASKFIDHVWNWYEEQIPTETLDIKFLEETYLVDFEDVSSIDDVWDRTYTLAVWFECEI